jgi:hypothetical protein
VSVRMSHWLHGQSRAKTAPGSLARTPEALLNSHMHVVAPNPLDRPDNQTTRLCLTSPRFPASFPLTYSAPPGPGFRGRLRLEIWCECAEIWSQSARADGPGNSGP